MRRPSKIPSYAAGNQLAARIILANPRRHLAWSEPLTDAEVDASLMVRWAREVTETQIPQNVLTDRTICAEVGAPRSEGVASYNPSSLTGHHGAADRKDD